MSAGNVSAVFIALHAGTACVALITGVFVRRRPRWFATYYWSLVLMVAFLVVGVAVDMEARQPGVLVIDATLVALAGFMVWRAEQARRLADYGSQRWAEHVGFTVVGLVDAFVVVTLFDVGLPGWLVAVVGAAIAVVGHVLIGHRPTPRSSPPAEVVGSSATVS